MYWIKFCKLKFFGIMRFCSWVFNPKRCGFFRNLAKIAKKLWFFEVENHKIDFSEAAFEVHYLSVSQKLVILGFSPIFFWYWPWSLPNHSEAKLSASLTSKFSWSCQLSYGTLFVGSVSKLEPPETTISHRVILDLRLLRPYRNLQEQTN